MFFSFSDISTAASRSLDELIYDPYEFALLSNIQTIEPSLQEAYGLISNIASAAQDNMNHAIDVKLKAAVPEFDSVGANIICNNAAKAKTQEELDAALTEPVKTHCKRVVDKTQRKNAELHNKAGLKVRVSREYDGVGLHRNTKYARVCSWCEKREGSNVPYEKAFAKGMFERHDGCGCLIEYTSEKGKTTYSNGKSSGWSDEKPGRDERIENEKKYIEMLRRKIGEHGQEIIDKPTYNKLTKDFIKNGGVIIRGEEAKKWLEGKGTASYFMGGNIAFIKDDATISDVLEEMFHAQQDRKKVFGDLPEKEKILRMEIQAQEYLISVTKKYKIPLEEVKVTQENLKYYKNELKKYLTIKNEI